MLIPTSPDDRIILQHSMCIKPQYITRNPEISASLPLVKAPKVISNCGVRHILIISNLLW